MKICQFFKKLFGCKLDYNPKGTYNVSENKLFGRDKNNINKIPDNEFICPNCNFETVPEILGIKPYTGNLAIFCKYHDEIINISPTEYIDKLIKIDHGNPDNKREERKQMEAETAKIADDQNNRIRCLECLKSKGNGKGNENFFCIECKSPVCKGCYETHKGKHSNQKNYFERFDKKKNPDPFIQCSECKKSKKNEEGTENYFCIKCELPVCKICYETHLRKHDDCLIPFGEKKYRCKIHLINIAKNYCIDCEEAICDKDMGNHPGHRIKNFESLQSELNDHRKKIIKKMKGLENLPSALKLYYLADKYGDDETKTKIKNSIEKETNKKIEYFIEEENLDDNYVDLALYYLEKNGYKKEEKNEDKKEEKKEEKKEDNKKDKKKDKNDEKKKDKKDEKKKDKKDEKKKKKQKNTE